MLRCIWMSTKRSAGVQRNTVYTDCLEAFTTNMDSVATNPSTQSIKNCVLKVCELFFFSTFFTTMQTSQNTHHFQTLHPSSQTHPLHPPDLLPFCKIAALQQRENILTRRSKKSRGVWNIMVKFHLATSACCRILSPCYTEMNRAEPKLLSFLTMNKTPAVIFVITTTKRTGLVKIEDSPDYIGFL